MATIEELEAQRDALSDALAQGVYMVKHGDKTVMYQTSDQIRKALDSIETRLRRARGGIKRRFAYTSGKGL